MSLSMEEVYGPKEMFASDMRRILNSPEFSDIEFLIGEDREPIRAHKIILSGRCEVFRAMFAADSPKRGSEPKKAPYVLPDVRPTVFLTVLEFIYTNACQLSQATVVDVLASALEYGLEGLVQCSVTYILKGLHVDTACEAMQAAITYQQDNLRDGCMAFIEMNTRAVFKSPRFAELSEETLAYILGSDNLQADEPEIFGAMKEWGTVNMVVLDKPLKDVIALVVENIRFPLLSKEFLSRIEKEDANLVPVHLISKAWKYHATKGSEKPDPNDPVFRQRAGTKI
eukprot:m.268431 g.268431  ORF g.268431 m.268431 type:complete len:284 (+) comp78466_c0_seq1:212-1063(+)